MNRRYRAIVIFFLLAALSAIFPALEARAGGNAGDVIWNPNTRMPQYCDGTKWVAMPPFRKASNYQAYGRFFEDGQDDYEGTIATSGVTVTGSFWFRRAGNYGVKNYIYAEQDNRANGRTYFAIAITTADKINITGGRSNGNTVLNITGSSVIQDNLWHNVLFSIDLSAAQTAGKNPSIYLDDVAETVTVTTFTNNAIDFANANGDGYVGIQYDGGGSALTNAFYGGLSDFWLKGGTGAFIDFSVVGNRRYFIDANKKPVNIGAGGVVAGLTPDGWLCCSGDRDRFASNVTDWAHDVWHEPYYQTARGPSSNPIALTKLQTLTGASMSSTGQIAIQGNYAYVTDETNGKFNVINISNPSSMSVAGTLTDATAFPAGRATWGVVVDGNYAYVCANGLITVDISNPASPSKVGTLSDSRICAANGASYGNPIAMKGKYLYTQDGQSPDHFAVIDKSTPTALSIVSVTNVGDYDDDGMVVAGDYAYMTGNGNLSVVDISNPAAPIVVSTTGLADGTQTGMTIDPGHGNLLYLTGNQQLFEPVDVTNRSAPIDPGWNGFIYPPSQSTLVMKGIAVSGNRLYIASNSGSPVLFVYDITDPANPQYLVDSTNATCSGCRGIAVKGNNIFTTLETGGGLISWKLTEGGTSCASPAGNEGDIIYNGGSNHVMQYCDGSSWQPLGPSPGATSGSSCITPTGNEGDLIFNQDYRVMQYCDSKRWMSVPSITPSYNPLPLAPTSGLAGWWKFDDAYGSGTAADSSGNGNAATVNNSRSFTNVAEYGAGALSFNGTTDYAELNSPAALTNLTALTFSAWIKPPSGNFGSSVDPVIEKGSGSTVLKSMYLDESGGSGDGTVLGFIKTSATAASCQTSSGAIKHGFWSHITMTYDDAGTRKCTIYVNGVNVTNAQTAATGTITSDTGNNMNFAATPGTQFYHYTGVLDDIRIYNRALSTTEISNLYQATATVPDPVGWWKLDESSGTIASDSSGYANDATMGYYYCCTLPTWAPTGGKINGALQVSSASTNYVQTADTTSLQLSGSWTISGWINLTSLPPLNNYYTMVTRGVSGPSNYGLGVDNEFCAPGTVEWFLWNNDTGGGFPHVCYGGTINANTWYFIAGTYDSTTLTQTLYVNGTAVANGTQSLPPYSSAGTGVSIGYDDCCNGGFANATIDDVRVYNRVLSAAEISALYASPSGGSCP